MDENAADFPDDIGDLAETIDNTGNAGFPKCNEGTCPDRFIEVNTSDQFVSADRQTDAGADPSQYTLHPVSQTEFFTDPNTAPSEATGYSGVSFYQLMEHEIGHFLGLHHPDDTVNGQYCTNCYTANPWYNANLGAINPNGFRTVMAQNNISPLLPYNAPVTLTSEDECQFQKLYCNTCGGGSGTAPCAYDDGVSEPNPQQDGFNPEIHPNPSTGATELDYTVADRSFVQVAIYDVLGKQVRLVSSGYEESGSQSISLGTEALPSGNYVCRVRVGDRVSYINLAITK